ncbi:tRNA methyltransferase complex GCD14 subunit [Aaosphaeria arxii CBS 175.79]|uniref:tRNA (adenine(58)-N(1))-methyltransferase catalytic subunit TRM61 n=1 Tax=Aaosphaeria arxii CBS 175.79 TaxID=1450172 RepID=A0A6A5Y6V8_9PLEO|nr:tRNA methyltransferase complex GCD14 subunit [Aaosphaeria arxii CBS 175.79]KAF2021268.1 tRNA methyltransferase complex GCD14 subunit [Aaosphaeria arxii CBS 175.79]
MAHSQISPFLDPGTHSAPNSLGILQLRRDHLIPAVLSSTSTDTDYAEGKVENTRFGSFPHSTLLNQPWGTQIRASVVDTGSRAKSKKRKREGGGDGDTETSIKSESENNKKVIAQAATASSGFAHLVPPTPETWTLCLPHRTQVVYTPDYSYILQRLRVRPGDHIIEAGAGSGSFTHAAARAVFNGLPGQDRSTNGGEQEIGEDGKSAKRRHKRHGGVYSFEFHEPRARQLKAELEEHGLGSLVTVTNRDVYEDGFCLDNDAEPNADVIFLDLPAPWLALKHLTRSPPSNAVLKSVASDDMVPDGDTSTSTPQPSTASKPFRSPLNPKNAVRICTFSPCIEQVIKTVSAMRSLGWIEIGMAEVQAKRLEVRRERIGLQEEGLRGANPNAATVQEAVQRLRDVEGRAKVFHGMQKEKQEEVMRKAEARKRGEKLPQEKKDGQSKARLEGVPPSKHDRMERAKKDLESRDLFKEGRLVHRTEPELKTHTSYLVFALLPREWSKSDEEKARRKWT